MKFLDVVGSGQPKMVMPSAACAKAAYNTLYGSSTEAPKTGRRSPAFFMVHGRLVLVFSWEPALEPDLVASVVRLALLAGGKELEDKVKSELLARRRDLAAKKPFEPLVIHHPKVKPC